MQRQFILRSSHYLAAMLIAAHGATLAALFPLAFPLWAKVALAFLVVLSLGSHLRREAWLSDPSSTVELILEGDQIMLTTRAGKHLACKLLQDSLVTPFLTVLNVLPLGARFSRSVIILPDSLEAESFRQLRVWLKWGSENHNRTI